MAEENPVETDQALIPCSHGDLDHTCMTNARIWQIFVILAAVGSFVNLDIVNRIDTRGRYLDSVFGLLLKEHGQAKRFLDGFTSTLEDNRLRRMVRLAVLFAALPFAGVEDSLHFALVDLFKKIFDAAHSRHKGHLRTNIDDLFFVLASIRRGNSWS